MGTDGEEIDARDVLSERREDAIEPFDAADRSLSLRALEHDRAVVEALDARRERAVHHRLRPAREEVDVAREIHRVHRMRAGRTGRDLAEYHFPVALAIPLHVREPRAQA